MSEALEELARHIEVKRPDSVLTWDISHGELTMSIALSSLVSMVDFLKTDNNCKFSTLVDITGVDYPSREARFDVVYHFLSMYMNHRVRLKVAVREEDVVPSLSSIHASANWFEREAVSYTHLTLPTIYSV